MTYKFFEQEIMRMAAEATHSARLRFATETIALLRVWTAVTVKTELPQLEQEVLTDILNSVAYGSVDGLSVKLKHLAESLWPEDSDSAEYHPNITELFCAIDNLIEYSATGSPRYIGQIAINMVNAIDYAIDGDSQTYSIDNMLAAPQMRAEFERQKRILTSVEP